MKLHCEKVHQGTPERWALVLHGVFGSGANFRLFMRELTRQRSDWGFVLVDLRGHAGSIGGERPHSIAALAADLDETAEALGLEIHGVIGHSLGGKIALAYARRHRGALDQVWSLDSQPGTRAATGGATGEVLAILESLPETFAHRQGFVAAVTARGQSKTIANWLAMNVRRDGDHYRLSLDLEAVRQILEDFWAQDLWSELEHDDGRRALHVVVGGQSFVWHDDDRARLEELGRRGSIALHRFEKAGHWLHVDAAEELRALMRERL